MQGRSIAVVEDESVIADAVADRLRTEGFAVEIAGDGPGAIELCRSLRPDAVILDLMLPASTVSRCAARSSATATCRC